MLPPSRTSVILASEVPHTLTEPKTKSDQIDYIYPWLLHWTIRDERIGNFRGDAFAVKTNDGLVLIDPLPLTEEVWAEIKEVCAILLTHGNHQRSAWRFRQKLGVPVFAPAGSSLDEEPDHWFSEEDQLPGDFQAIKAIAFQNTFYLVFEHPDGTGVLFCGDLICHDEGGPYRFPVQPGYFNSEDARLDVKRLMKLSLQVMCPGHAIPNIDGCNDVLQGAIDRIA